MASSRQQNSDKPADSQYPLPDDEGMQLDPLPLSNDEADRRARIEYLRSLTVGQKPQRPWPKIIAIIILLSLIAGGTLYWFVLRSPEPSDTSQQKAASSQQQAAEKAKESEKITTKHYDSTAFNLGFDYPEDWKINNEASKLLVTSPAMKLKTPEGTASGQVVLAIQPKQTSLPAFKNGNAIATIPSEKITYLKPSPTQRAQTYLTPLTYASPAADTPSAGIDGIYITGDFGYQKGQVAPQVDIVRVDPLISFSFAKCNDQACPASQSVATPLTVAENSWNDKAPYVRAIKTILTSLTIQ